MIRSLRSKREFITIEDLAKALEARSIEETGEKIENARGIAELTMGFFGYMCKIIDNTLRPPERDVFYQLENLNLLKTSQEETKLYDGRDWRIHYWHLKVEEIDRLLEPAAGIIPEDKGVLATTEIYENLDWTRHEEPEETTEQDPAYHQKLWEKVKEEEKEKEKSKKPQRISLDGDYLI